MLRHAHFYMKGGKEPFAALCIEVCCAGQSGLVHVQLLLAQKPFAYATKPVLRCRERRRTGHCLVAQWPKYNPHIRSWLFLQLGCRIDEQCYLMASDHPSFLVQRKPFVKVPSIFMSWFLGPIKGFA